MVAKRNPKKKAVKKSLPALSKYLNGWISPEGKGTWSKYGFHWDMAARILKTPDHYVDDPEYALQKLGYVKVQTADNSSTYFIPFYRGDVDTNHVTQKQLDLIFDLCETYDIPQPEFLRNSDL